MEYGSNLHTSSSSRHSVTSFPDPADEDVLGQNAIDQPRLPLANRRMPSYTAFLSNRTFSPDVRRENNLGDHVAKNESPTVRTPSETTSTNDDWRTAASDSFHGDRSARSRSQTPENRFPSVNGGRSRTQQRDVTSQNRGPPSLSGGQNINTKSPVNNGDLSDRTDARIRHRLSSANLQRQAEMREEEMRTPQASRQRRITVDDSASMISAAPSTVLDELEELKRRINRLELGPRNSPPQLASMPSPVGRNSYERLRPRTGDSYSSSSIGYQSTSQRMSPASPGHAHPLLRASISKLKLVDVPAELLHPLDFAVADALLLAASSSDKVLQGRADALCRSLTEVCLYLQKHHFGQTPSPERTAWSNVDRSSQLSTGHARRQSLNTFATMPRSSSSRRSLADIVKSTDDALDRASALSVDRSSSRLSRVADNHRTSLPTTSETIVDRRAHPNEIAQRLASARSPLSESTDRDRHRSSRNLAENVVNSYDQGRRDVNEVPGRATSRAATDVLERSPVTREGLYARYQRGSPRQPGDVEDDTSSIMSRQSSIRRRGTKVSRGSRNALYQDETRTAGYEIPVRHQ